MPITVIDTPQGKLLSNEKLPAHVLLGLDLQIIVKNAWNALTNSDKAETSTWLHTNHLGAPEAATNSEGQIIWQASYAPFGAVSIIDTPYQHPVRPELVEGLPRTSQASTGSAQTET